MRLPAGAEHLQDGNGRAGIRNSDDALLAAEVDALNRAAREELSGRGGDLTVGNPHNGVRLLLASLDGPLEGGKVDIVAGLAIGELLGNLAVNCHDVQIGDAATAVVVLCIGGNGCSRGHLNDGDDLLDAQAHGARDINKHYAAHATTLRIEDALVGVGESSGEPARVLSNGRRNALLREGATGPGDHLALLHIELAPNLGRVHGCIMRTESKLLALENLRGGRNLAVLGILGQLFISVGDFTNALEPLGNHFREDESRRSGAANVVVVAPLGGGHELLDGRTVEILVDFLDNGLQGGFPLGLVLLDAPDVCVESGAVHRDCGIEYGTSPVVVLGGHLSGVMFAAVTEMHMREETELSCDVVHPSFLGHDESALLGGGPLEPLCQILGGDLGVNHLVSTDGPRARVVVEGGGHRCLADAGDGLSSHGLHVLDVPALAPGHVEPVQELGLGIVGEDVRTHCCLPPHAQRSCPMPSQS